MNIPTSDQYTHIDYSKQSWGTVVVLTSPRAHNFNCAQNIKEVLHLQPQMSIFCALSQNIIDTFLKGGKTKTKMHLTTVQRTQKWHWNFSRQNRFKSRFKKQKKQNKTKTVKMLFGSKYQEPIGPPKFWCYFWVPCIL